MQAYKYSGNYHYGSGNFRKCVFHYRSPYIRLNGAWFLFFALVQRLQDISKNSVVCLGVGFVTQFLD